MFKDRVRKDDLRIGPAPQGLECQRTGKVVRMAVSVEDQIGFGKVRMRRYGGPAVRGHGGKTRDLMIMQGIDPETGPAKPQDGSGVDTESDLTARHEKTPLSWNRGWPHVRKSVDRPLQK